jgi:formamidopyrimidine-DNA glycosylase
MFGGRMSIPPDFHRGYFMPELPEVETVANQLAPLVRGRRVLALELFDPKLQAMIERPEAAAGRVIEDVRRFGKQAVIIFESDPESDGARHPLWLAVHLRMTGRLIYHTRGDAVPVPPTRARLALDRGFILFCDVRRFGTLRLIRKAEELAPGGLDPVGPDFTSAALATLLEGSRQALKPWLLRQDRLVGIGNIYASEILHAARLSPFRLGASLTPAEIRRLHQATVKILRWGIECGGTTFSDFQDAHGASGEFQKKLKVYGREGEPCRRCRTAVARVVQQSRSTFYCPACQGEND